MPVLPPTDAIGRHCRAGPASVCRRAVAGALQVRHGHGEPLLTSRDGAAGREGWGGSPSREGKHPHPNIKHALLLIHMEVEHLKIVREVYSVSTDHRGHVWTIGPSDHPVWVSWLDPLTPCQSVSTTNPTP